MGSLATHISTLILIFPIGYHRLHCCISHYLKDPSHYHSKPWFFTPQKWPNFHFYALLVALPLAFLYEFIMFLSFSGYPSYRFAFLEHATLSLLFWALLILIILKENSDLLMSSENFVFVLGGICFLVEYFVNGNGFSGVSRIVYDLGGELTLVCAFCCLYLPVQPTGFFADFCLSVGLMLKGTWGLQVGLNLCTQTFGLKGCHVLALLPDKDKVDVKCDLDEDGLRGVALMNFVFVWHVIVVLISCFGLFGLLSSKEGLRCGEEGGGPLLARIESRNMLMQLLPELEMD